MKATESTTLQGNPVVVLDRVAYVHLLHVRSGDMIVGCTDVNGPVGTVVDEGRSGLQRIADAPTHDDFVAFVEERELHLEEKAMLGRKEVSRIRTSTPWGQADSKTEYGRGVNSYGTPGHGGFKVSAGLNASMPAHLRNADGWYEEDCEWAKVAVAFPERFTTYEKKEAMRTLLNWHPDAWEIQTGEKVLEGMSRARDEKIFHERHANDYVVVSATYSDAHPGMVEVTATIGGDREKIRTSEEKSFLVPKEEYTSNRFVVDPERHAELVSEAPAPRF